MDRIISQLYELPLYSYFVILFAVIAIWTLFACRLKGKRIWKRINAALLSVSLLCIIAVALLFRGVADKGFSVVPFYSLELAKTYSDIYSEIALNILLFLPIGLTAPYVMEGKSKHPVFLTVVFSACLSLTLEVLQLAFMRGYAEIDDVIFNTAGAVTGCLSYFLTNRMMQRAASDKR